MADILKKSYKEKLEQINVAEPKKEDLNNLKNDPDYRVREAIAKKGYFLDTYAYDHHKAVRKAVVKFAGANEKLGVLNKMLEDPCWEIKDLILKYDPAQAQYYLHQSKDHQYTIHVIEMMGCKEEDIMKLVQHNNRSVRNYICKNFTDILMQTEEGKLHLVINGVILNLYKDKSSKVRAAVALTKSHLETLFNDKSVKVQTAVASTGYRNSAMCNAENVNVRKQALVYRFTDMELVEDILKVYDTLRVSKSDKNFNSGKYVYHFEDENICEDGFRHIPISVGNNVVGVLPLPA